MAEAGDPDAAAAASDVHASADGRRHSSRLSSRQPRRYVDGSDEEGVGDNDDVDDDGAHEGGHDDEEDGDDEDDNEDDNEDDEDGDDEDGNLNAHGDEEDEEGTIATRLRRRPRSPRKKQRSGRASSVSDSRGAARRHEARRRSFAHVEGALRSGKRRRVGKDEPDDEADEAEDHDGASADVGAAGDEEVDDQGVRYSLRQRKSVNYRLPEIFSNMGVRAPTPESKYVHLGRRAVPSGAAHVARAVGTDHAYAHTHRRRRAMAMHLPSMGLRGRSTWPMRRTGYGDNDYRSVVRPSGRHGGGAGASASPFAWPSARTPPARRHHPAPLSEYGIAWPAREIGREERPRSLTCRGTRPRDVAHMLQFVGRRCGPAFEHAAATRRVGGCRRRRSGSKRSSTGAPQRARPGLATYACRRRVPTCEGGVAANENIVRVLTLWSVAAGGGRG